MTWCSFFFIPAFVNVYFKILRILLFSSALVYYLNIIICLSSTLTLVAHSPTIVKKPDLLCFSFSTKISTIDKYLAIF